jgi:hypothetical protein
LCQAGYIDEAAKRPAERPIAWADPAELPDVHVDLAALDADLTAADDDVTPELATVVQRISGLPMAERMKHAKDLGEIMVIAHAVVAAESGQSVTVLIDDGPGAAIAMSEIRWRTR